MALCVSGQDKKECVGTAVLGREGSHSVLQSLLPDFNSWCDLHHDWINISIRLLMSAIQICEGGVEITDQ